MRKRKEESVREGKEGRSGRKKGAREYATEEEIQTLLAGEGAAKTDKRKERVSERDEKRKTKKEREG